MRCEGLEERALLATSGVAAFAAIPGRLTAASQTSQVVLPIAAGQFRADQAATVVLGFAVRPADGSPVNPRITRVTGPNGRINPLPLATSGTSALDQTARQTRLFARVIPLATQPQTITLDVTRLNSQAGDYIVDAFLAGDATGDGNVDFNDLTAIQSAYGARVGQANYNAAADFNGDGRVGCFDRTLATLNLGAHLVVPAATAAPVVAATSYATPSPIVPLAVASPPVNLVPESDPTVIAPPIAPPIAVATPVPAAATPPVVAPLPVAYVPVTLAPVTTSTSGTNPTPVYYLAEPGASTGATATSAPIYLYGRPVVGGSPGYPAATSPAASLFGRTTTAQPAGASTPIPVYLYEAPR